MVDSNLFHGYNTPKGAVKLFVIVDNKEECAHRHETMEEAMTCLASFMDIARKKNTVCYKTIVEVETEEELEELRDSMVLY